MFTLVLPALLRRPHEPVPPLAVPALNDLLRYGRFQAAPLSRGALYQSYCCDRLTLPENQIYASPVWQRMGMNSADMLALHDIRTDEAQAWCAELTAFYENRYTFRPLRPDLWTLELPAPPQWQADSIWNVCGQLDGTQTAHGADTREWLRLTTEIQMWLHNHPQNAKREAAGQPPANGLWLWNAPAAAVSGCPLCPFRLRQHRMARPKQPPLAAGRRRLGRMAGSLPHCRNQPRAHPRLPQRLHRLRRHRRHMALPSPVRTMGTRMVRPTAHRPVFRQPERP